VYSLGVILYELLAGRPPLDVRSTGVPEALRRVREEEPTRLGTLDRSLRGDLDTIVAKAMEKDPRRRYETAAELAADLRRWLADQPIVARRPSTLYQASKFVLRHRALVAGAAVVFLALSTAVVAVSAALVRVERQGQRTREVNAFMRGLLASADPFSVPAGPRAVGGGGGGAPAVRAADMLGAAEAWLAEHPIDDPLVEADIRDALGVSCSGLGRHDGAVAQLERALHLRTQRLGQGAVPTLECASHLATALTRAEALERAEAMHRAAIAGLARALGDADPLVLKARFELVMCLIHENKFDQAAALAGQVEEAARATGEASIAALAAGLRSVSIIYSIDDEQGRLLAEGALTDIERTCGRDHYVAALVTCTLGGVAEGRHDLAEAERRYRAAADSYARLLGERDPRTASRLVSLGRVLDGLGRYAEAEDPLRRALATESVGTPLARQIAEQARTELTVCLRGQGRGPEAPPVEPTPR
jgi:eukaryotic-like serine/threonine-protein kinase